MRFFPGNHGSVSHNPDHGELEFCNLWPVGSFVPGTSVSKRYSHCFVERGASRGEASSRSTTLLPHHHLETSDKHNITMAAGDRFGWLLEEENPLVELASVETVNAGLCAYMWDAHLAYRCCDSPRDLLLPEGTRRKAAFRIFSLNREEAAEIFRRGEISIPPDLASIPIYQNGMNRFTKAPTQEGPTTPPAHLWPWTFTLLDPRVGQLSGDLDGTVGYDDFGSLRINGAGPGIGQWTVTTLGPAFSDPPFNAGNKYRLSAYIRTASLEGKARIGIRLHRGETAGLGDTSSYELYWSALHCTGSTPWTHIHLVTPSIAPRPDRVHLLLEHQGAGTSWFDNVLFEVL